MSTATMGGGEDGGASSCGRGAAGGQPSVSGMPASMSLAPALSPEPTYIKQRVKRWSRLALQTAQTSFVQPQPSPAQ